MPFRSRLDDPPALNRVRVVVDRYPVSQLQDSRWIWLSLVWVKIVPGDDFWRVQAQAAETGYAPVQLNSRTTR